VRVLHVSPYYPPARLGGVGEVARSLHEGLLRRGHDSLVVTRGRGSGDGVRRIARSRLGWFLATALWARRAAGYDVVHFHSGEALPLLLALRLARRRRARVLVTLHVGAAQMARAERPYRLAGRRFGRRRLRRRALLGLHRLVDRAALRLADAVTTAARATALDLVGPERAGSIDVIPNGVPPPAEPPGPSAEPVELLYAGVAGDRKRVTALPFVLRRVRESVAGARLRIAGFDLDRDPDLAALFRATGTREAVDCVGPLARPDLAAHYRSARVLVLPAAYEGLPLVILEAMREGTPVVATRVGGNAEAVEDGVTGFLVGVDSPDEMAERCVAILRDPGLAARLGAAARARVRERFGLERQLEAYLERYRRLCSGGGSPPRAAPTGPHGA
jgi:glycosyltransferase involved in cell wall biosynthesis